MKQALKYGLVALCAVCLCGALAACGEEKKAELSAPENFRMEDEILYWDEVDGATKYYVYLEGSGTYVSEPSFDTFGLITERGTHPIEVIALGDEKSTMESEPAVYEYTVGYQGFMYRETGKGGYEITANPDNPPKGLLVIPEEIDGKPVTGIVDRGFANCTEMTAAILPDNMANFGLTPFNSCTSLRRVKLPSYLTTIYVSMFLNCTSLWDCELPALVKEISPGAFQNCLSLKELYIPASATKLYGTSWEGNRFEHIEVAEGNPVFYSEGNCIIRRADKELVVGCGASVIPNDVVSIGSMAFGGMGITEMAIPQSVTSIKSYAFSGNPMTSFVLPAGVTEIGDVIFWNCEIENLSVAEGNNKYYGKGNCILTREDNTVVLGCKNSVIPPEARAIGQRAFMDCEGLREIEIPSNIEQIGDKAFSECRNLRHIYLANGLKKLGSYVFEYCWSLDGIAIPESVTEIATDAFISAYSYIYMAWGKESQPGDFYINDTYGIDGYCFDCILAYDEEGYCYVVSTSQLEAGENYFFYSISWAAAPIRRGYTFAGWATEEGGEVVFQPEIFSGTETEFFTQYTQEVEQTRVQFGEDNHEAYQKLMGLTLYAVWIQNN